MVAKNIKLIIYNAIFILLVTVVLMPIVCPAVYGLSLDLIYEEGPEEPPDTPPDTPTTPIETPPSTSGHETISFYNEINGTIYESIGKNIGTNGTDDHNNVASIIKKPIEGVTVQLWQDDTLVSSMRTGSDGKYSFSPSPGTYYTKIVYGDIDNEDLNNKEKIKNILKYNGHDYIVSQTPDETTYIDTERLDVTSSGKGALQLFLAIDCSYSVRHETINGKTKLELITDAAKELCSSLLEMNKNIYIGLIFFSGESYRAVSLTKDESLLKEALNNINTNNWQRPNTNFCAALDKAYASYYNNDSSTSNRYLVLLSDGIPTSDGTNQVYSTDTDQTRLINKINTIANNTNAKLNSIKNSGVKIISLFTKTNDDEIDTIVKNVFKDSNVFQELGTIEDAAKCVKENLKNAISGNATSRIYTSTTDHTVLKGYEDANRREAVDKMFEEYNNLLNYSNTIMFDLIDNYTASDENKELATLLSNKTCMTAVGGRNYIIRNVPNPSVERDEEGNIIREYIADKYKNQDIVLSKREQFTLATDITATRLNVTLSNGAVLKEQTKAVGAGENEFLLQYVEGSYFYGAEVCIDYTINIKNPSSIQCDYLELLIQIPKGFKYKAHSSGTLTSESAEDLIQRGLVTTSINTGRELYKIVLDNNNQGSNGFYIPPGGEGYSLTVTVSRKTTGEDDSAIQMIDDFCAEVLQYKNQANRRMTQLQTVGTISTKVSYLKGIYPGDSNDIDYSHELTNSFVALIPPTGIIKNEDLIPKIICITLSIMAIMLTIILYKRK